MATITLKGNAIHTCGDLPAVGSAAPEFSLLRNDLSTATPASYSGKRKVLSVFPSIDTPVCATSVRTFNQKAASLANTVVLNISADLPFAQKRFCAAEGISGVETLSTFRSSFAKDYGLEIADGALAGLCSRAIVVLDENNKVLYTEQVPEIAQEPNYDAALAALG
ncbi:MAG: thiol peroxidase [Candidatus Omnitrophica bacterium]|nr:Thiol peroxidase [bacterium]NUN98908.1 thiol peroxidase [Candidatus Omnitrophota bacterium]